ncbi:MAG TPA: TM2 domain-containing protein [Ktedonobacterales bacterium]
MDAIAKEQWALALLTARFDCAQQEFFQAEYGRRRRSPAVALALCLTLGAFGAHEFYMGRLRSAALRLLFCWTLIPLLLALAEATFLTRRVHAYNAAVARLLAEIVEESFAAIRAQDAEFATADLAPERPAPRAVAAPAPRPVERPVERPAAQQPAWDSGFGRALAPAGARWPLSAPLALLLAEERMAQ